ncbi:transglycosylase SLT domain-containing protein [Halovulum marinum]|uniref:transglycosylase SLT domain-containing protein n=1 Tax=Halovulum marinum TaxID=2662447 RepID=UPI002D791BDD|nr:transglycosylase SLT domain-containing protein [Halovulum marinum]
MLRTIAAVLTACLLWSAPAAASAQLCDEAGARAARDTGVPYAVLRAISLTETGRKRDGQLQPWPWTVNMEGKGTWFDDRATALSYVRAHHAGGARSYDVGCFQINYRWHGNAFASVEEMFDPYRNALYAAQFLKRLYAETGSWAKSAGAYHSRTPQYATRYQARFERILARLSGETPPPVAATPAPASQPARVIAAAQQYPRGATVGLPQSAPRGSLAAVLGLPAGSPILAAPGRPLY